MLTAGYRPAGGERHRTSFEAAGEILGPDFTDLIRKIHKFRIKRNACVYDPAGLIANNEAEAIHQTARDPVFLM